MLVVEDERIQRQVLQAKVAGVSKEISVRTAYNGVEGLIKIGEQQPQILITDLMMPGVDGFHLLSTLMSSPMIRPMQIIVVTGMSEEDIQQRGGLPEGVVLFHKPVQITELLAVVRAYFNGWSLQRKSVGLNGAMIMAAAKATILVVDDEANNRNVMVAQLASEGYELLTADCGEDALELIDRRLPDLILLDVMMPASSAVSTLPKSSSRKSARRGCRS